MNLKIIFEKIKELVNEGTLIFDNESLKLIEMDPANVAEVILEYKIKSKLKGKYFINIRNFAIILNRFKEDPEFDVQDGYLVIKEGDSVFKIKIIERVDKEFKVPKLDYKENEFFIDARRFHKIVEDADNISENIYFTKEGFLAEEDLSKYDCKFPMVDKAKYSLEYLRKMTFEYLQSNMKIEYKKDYVLRLTYWRKDKYRLEFLLAPRVDE